MWYSPVSCILRSGRGACRSPVPADKAAHSVRRGPGGTRSSATGQRAGRAVAVGTGSVVGGSLRLAPVARARGRGAASRCGECRRACVVTSHLNRPALRIGGVGGVRDSIPRRQKKVHGIHPRHPRPAVSAGAKPPFIRRSSPCSMLPEVSRSLPPPPPWRCPPPLSPPMRLPAARARPSPPATRSIATACTAARATRTARPAKTRARARTPARATASRPWPRPSA